LAATLLAACAPLPPPASPAAVTTTAATTSATAADDSLDDADRQQLERQRQPVLGIDTAASLITIVARRGGALARLGHDHVIASRTLEGWVAPAQGRATLRFRLDRMSVDEPALRDAAGLARQPSPEAIAGTRTNMLTRVLDAERYPYVRLRVTRAAGADSVDVAITLHGVTRHYTVPTRIDSAAGGSRLLASGALTLKQTDFGLVPFAVMGGAMAVQDQLELQFRISAAKP